MAKYLDISGLQRVWNRISSRVIRGDVAQSFTDAYKMQARANISAGASNRNLLDNPFFTVRQMGTGGVTGVGYAVDRWKNTGGANLTQTPRSPYGITFASSSGYQVDQALWDYPAEYLDGERLTISVMTSGGNIAQATGVFTATSSTAAKVAVTSADGNFTVGLYYIPSALAVPFVRITTPSGKFPVNAPILAAKLELGSYSTLANDVPPDCGEELRKCQYYFERVKTAGTMVSLGIGYNDGYNTMYGVMKIEPKRVTPSLSGSSLLVGTTSLNTTSSSKSIYSFASDGTAVIQIVATNAFSTNQPYRFGLPANGYLDFSADL